MTNILSAADLNDVVLDDEHPWPGLMSFSELNRHYFNGREPESNELTRMIESDVLTVMYGKSGLGKSSLLQAGISPRLRRLQLVPVYMRLNYGAAPEAGGAETSLTAALWNRFARLWKSEDIQAPPRSGSETLWEYFHRRNCDWWDRANQLVRPVLIFDQFEELFTARRRASDAQAARLDAFIAELSDLIENRPPLSLIDRAEKDADVFDRYDFDSAPCRVVLALRDDFLSDLEQLRDRISSLMRNRFALLALSGEQALDVVLMPGHRLVDERVAAEIVSFVSSSGQPDAAPPGNAPAIREVDPALLSVVLEELNNSRLEHRERRISSNLLGDGRAEGILKSFYERQLQGESDEVRDFIVDRLLTAKGSRNLIAEEDACAEPGIDTAVIERLIRKRLIQRERFDAVKWLELTHDRLAEVVRADRAEQEKRRQRHAADAAREEAATAQQEAEAALAREAETRRVLSRLQDRAERDAEDIVERLDRLLADTTAGAAAIVRRTLLHVQTDAGEFASARLHQLWARAACASAEILRSQGYIAESIAAATAALDAVSRAEAQHVDGDCRTVRAAALYNLGEGKRAIGELVLAETSLRGALHVLEGMTDAAARRVGTRARIGLGHALFERGLEAEAIAAYEQSGNELDDDPDEPAAYLRATALLGEAEARRLYKLTQPIYRRIDALVDMRLAAHPQSQRWRLLRADLRFAEGFDTIDRYGWTKNKARLKEALREGASIYEDDRDNLTARHSLAQLHRVLGMHYEKAGERDRAKSQFDRMREHAEAVCDQQPLWVAAVRTNAISRYYQAQFVGRRRELIEEGCRLLEALAARVPGQVTLTHDLAVFQAERAARSASDEQALQLFGAAADLLESASPGVRSTASYQTVIGEARMGSAAVRQRLGRSVDECQAEYRAAIAAFDATLAADPVVKSFKNLAAAHLAFGLFLLVSGDRTRAVVEFRAALEVCVRGLAEHPANVDLLSQRCAIGLEVARRCREHAAFDEAISFELLAIEAAESAIGVEPNSFVLCSNLKDIHGEGTQLVERIETAAGANDALRSPLITVKQALDRIEPNRLLWSVAQATPWDVPPLIQAGWRELTRVEREHEVQQWLETNYAGIARSFGRIRAASVSFYPDGVLYEAEVPRADAATSGVFTYVRSGGETLILDGTSTPIHAFHATEAVDLLLDSPAQAADYARFFAAAIQGSDGNFRIIAALDEVPVASPVDFEQLARYAQDIIPMQLHEAPNGAWDFKATARYGRTLFNSLFQVPQNGVVEIKEDHPLVRDLPVLNERFENGLRIVRDGRDVQNDQTQQAGDGQGAALEAQRRGQAGAL